MINVKRLWKLFDATTRGEWSDYGRRTREDRSAHRVMVNDKGQVIFDTFNSEVACIEEEGDDDGIGIARWDSTGEANFEWIEAVHNCFGELLRTITDLREKVEELEELRSDK